MKSSEHPNSQLSNQFYDRMAEISVLGSILLNNNCYHLVSAAGLTAQDFYAGAHGLMFTAMEKLNKVGTAMDLVTLRDELERCGDLEAVGGVPYISSLIDAVPAASNIGHYVEIVLENSRTRALMGTVTQVQKELYEGGRVADVTQQLMTDIAHHMDRRDGTGLVSFNTVCERWAKQYHAARGVKPLSTGLSDLDVLLGGGLRPGQLVLPAGRTGIGKTTFAFNIALHAAREGKRVMFFSLEMDAEQLFHKGMVTMFGRELRDMLRSRKIADMKRMGEQVQDLRVLPIMVDDTASLSIPQMTARCQIEQAKIGINLIVVDYIQLVRPPHGRQRSRVEEVGELSRGLKRLARELHVPVIAPAQLNRLSETESPSLRHLRESGSLEQDADVVILLWKKNDDDEIVHAKVAKQRMGRTGTVELYFKKERQIFTSVIGGEE